MSAQYLCAKVFPGDHPSTRPVIPRHGDMLDGGFFMGGALKEGKFLWELQNL